MFRPPVWDKNGNLSEVWAKILILFFDLQHIKAKEIGEIRLRNEDPEEEDNLPMFTQLC